MLNVQTDHLENHTVRLTVEVDPDRVEQAMRQAARRISKKSRIPGFRPGKAPFDVVVNLFGREYILSEALDTLGNEIYREALEAAEIDPYAPGSLEDIADDGRKLVFVVPKSPEVTLGDYRAIRVEHEELDITDEMVDEAMENIRQGQALVELVEREARMGDQVTFSHIQITVLDESDATETEVADEASGETADDNDDSGERVLLHQHNYDLILRDDENALLPGFAEQIVGMSAEDEKEFTLTVPDDYEDEEVAGKTLRVEVHIEKVQSRTVPEWTDDLAKRVTEGEFETLLELRMNVRKQLEEQAQATARQEIADEALDKLVETATIHYPEELVQDYINDFLEDLERSVLRQQGLTIKDFLQITGQSEDDLRNLYRERAIARAERGLALGEFMRSEKLAVSGDEIDAEIDRLSQQFGGAQSDQFKKFLSTAQSRVSIHNDLISSRAIDRLIAIAKGEATDDQAHDEETVEEPEEIADEAPVAEAEEPASTTEDRS